MGLPSYQIQALESDPRDWFWFQGVTCVISACSWQEESRRIHEVSSSSFTLYPLVLSSQQRVNLTSMIQKCANFIYVIVDQLLIIQRVIPDMFLAEHILKGSRVLPHMGGLLKALGTNCQMAQRKVLLIYTLG